MPGIGFAMGLERLLLTLNNEKVNLTGLLSNPEIYIAVTSPKAQELSFRLAMELRKKGISTEKDYFGKSLKAQMKAADRFDVKFTLILGEEELANNKIIVKEMATSEQKEIPIDDILSYLERGLLKND